ncbi:hypothetical protein NM688_g3673 [Phlebia brevispora]|uniref:Uncharacterized protein n=1 Tax=Phlebia brevispora TaxID=194682 RepID=A0ACC1T560_9APHY|nr:hypothetical protein NM688_g3673 [Phlebia brevispora]
MRTGLSDPLQLTRHNLANEIDSRTEKLARLRRECERVQSEVCDLKTKKNRTVPISCLPAEVLSAVVVEHVADCWNEYISSSAYTPPIDLTLSTGTPYAWLAILGVCRDWRRVAFLTHVIWNLHCSPATPRSASETRRTYHTILQHLQRVHIAQLRIMDHVLSQLIIMERRNPDVPALTIEELTIDAQDHRNDTLPMFSTAEMSWLHLLDLRCASLPLLDTLVRPTLTSLTLTMRFMIPSGQFTGILERLPLLEHLTLSVGLPGRFSTMLSDDDIGPSSIVQLCHLKSLTLDGYLSQVAGLLNVLMFPQDTSIVLWSRENPPMLATCQEALFSIASKVVMSDRSSSESMLSASTFRVRSIAIRDGPSEVVLSSAACSWQTEFRDEPRPRLRLGIEEDHEEQLLAETIPYLLEPLDLSDLESMYASFRADHASWLRIFHTRPLPRLENLFIEGTHVANHVLLALSTPRHLSTTLPLDAPLDFLMPSLKTLSLKYLILHGDSQRSGEGDLMPRLKELLQDLADSVRKLKKLALIQCFNVQDQDVGALNDIHLQMSIEVRNTWKLDSNVGIMTMNGSSVVARDFQPPSSQVQSLSAFDYDMAEWADARLERRKPSVPKTGGSTKRENTKDPDALSVADRVPPEIWVLVFQHCGTTYESERIQDVYDGGNHWLRPWNWIAVSWVCHAWRDIVLSTPTLWTTIVLLAHPKLIELALDRSGSLPLTVPVVEQPFWWSSALAKSSGVLHMVMSSLSRIRDATFVISPPVYSVLSMLASSGIALQATILEELTIKMCIAEDGLPVFSTLSMPRLTSLRVENISVRLLAALTRRTLTSLDADLHPFTLDELVGVLQHLPSLQKLSLFSIVLSRWDEHPVLPPQSLPHLKRLTLWPSTDDDDERITGTAAYEESDIEEKIALLHEAVTKVQACEPSLTQGSTTQFRTRSLELKNVEHDEFRVNLWSTVRSWDTTVQEKPRLHLLVECPFDEAEEQIVALCSTLDLTELTTVKLDLAVPTSAWLSFCRYFATAPKFRCLHLRGLHSITGFIISLGRVSQQVDGADGVAQASDDGQQAPAFPAIPFPQLKSLELHYGWTQAEEGSLTPLLLALRSHAEQRCQLDVLRIERAQGVAAKDAAMIEEAGVAQSIEWVNCTIHPGA